MINDGLKMPKAVSVVDIRLQRTSTIYCTKRAMAQRSSAAKASFIPRLTIILRREAMLRILEHALSYMTFNNLSLYSTCSLLHHLNAYMTFKFRHSLHF